ncbi:hypothetical protein [Phenylobacterium aquaticum]|uniref:hypothetical protein n=1 Tax=Phenylobacterium aquaticum TaxID=1763816 RepID=UPI0026F27D7C|nr:hypothetical protein [Phenylobacterium aquaticum]
MVRPSDWPLIGLKRPDRPAGIPHPVPTSGAAQPFRELGELFPLWAANPFATPDPAQDNTP